MPLIATISHELIAVSRFGGVSFDIQLGPLQKDRRYKLTWKGVSPQVTPQTAKKFFTPVDGGIDVSASPNDGFYLTPSEDTPTRSVVFRFSVQDLPTALRNKYQDYNALNFTFSLVDYPDNVTGEQAPDVHVSFDLTESPTSADLSDTLSTLAHRPLTVRLSRTDAGRAEESILWAIIRLTTKAVEFENYKVAVDALLTGDGAGVPVLAGDLKRLGAARRLPFRDTDSYRLLKVATEAFLLVNGGVALDATELAAIARRLATELPEGQRPEGGVSTDAILREYLATVNGSTDRTLPYLQRVVRGIGSQVTVSAKNLIDDAMDVFPKAADDSILISKVTRPVFVELIWSYWHEEAMLCQAMLAIRNRFQNVRAGTHDPLAAMEIDPLRPLNNVLWGYIQDEQHRLTIARRSYEYDHQYGLRLAGLAVPRLPAAESRARFLEAFHNLLYLATVFYRDDDDTTRVADGFPILKALAEVHFLLAEGAHNQFGDLPVTSRQEMLMEQWILSRPEFREFLPRRAMVAYPESWMASVDAMKALQGWSDASVIYFHDLAVFGEQLLLTGRFGTWSTETDPNAAAAWARFWRPEILGYIHAYRAVTGVDLSADITDTRSANDRNLPPAMHLLRRLTTQRQISGGVPRRFPLSPAAKPVRRMR